MDEQGRAGAAMYVKQHGQILRVTVFMIFAIGFTAVTVDTDSDASFVSLTGQASWYSSSSPGILPTTANMEKFDQSKLTCAIWGLPFNTMIEVTNICNDRKVIVRVNDRGPAKRLCRQGRVIDLTMAAFSKIESLDKGLTKIKMRVIS